MSQTAKTLRSNDLSILKVIVASGKITAELSDNRIISIPIEWFPHLERATSQQLQKFEISPSGYGIHWPEIDEDISIKSFIG